MEKLSAVVFCLLLSVGMATAQTVPIERALPQWLTGLIAVGCFLFLSFVTLLVKKAWCDETSSVTLYRSSEAAAVETAEEIEIGRANSNLYDTRLSTFRSKEDPNAYENLVVESDDKVTTM
ncbi:PDZK1-interacting protein 1 isoform X1 [Scomber japonicus]|uniref:PDZK1-interacting protein 1 isoform X1 n=1 Tax=Scomber japonicus TaxID=13676 RepID=UPI002304F116|nr:PDZK1-interacting protein 1 isoform X1 [Scomber japonicus]